MEDNDGTVVLAWQDSFWARYESLILPFKCLFFKIFFYVEVINNDLFVKFDLIRREVVVSASCVNV